MDEAAPSPTHLACTVRGCGRALQREGTRLACTAGHTFDVARGGWVNLLQPQDRRSLAAGDSPEAVEARLRLAAAGADQVLWGEVGAWIEALKLDPAPLLAEVGCGPGVLLRRLCGVRPLAAHGIDLSSAAIRAAARSPDGGAPPRQPAWVVANAERRLPFGDGALDVLLSLRGPKHPPEFARVLAPRGHLLLGVPGRNDLAELRGATAGAGLPRDPDARALKAFGERFQLARRWVVRETLELPRAALRDLLAGVYRGARHSEAARLGGLDRLRVTQETVLLHLVPRPTDP